MPKVIPLIKNRPWVQLTCLLSSKVNPQKKINQQIYTFRKNPLFIKNYVQHYLLNSKYKAFPLFLRKKWMKEGKKENRKDKSLV